MVVVQLVQVQVLMWVLVWVLVLVLVLVLVQGGQMVVGKENLKGQDHDNKPLSLCSPVGEHPL
jgi:Tfp pilus assembly protein PilN